MIRFSRLVLLLVPVLCALALGCGGSDKVSMPGGPAPTQMDKKGASAVAQ